jgi:hypothetical protein
MMMNEPDKIQYVKVLQEKNKRNTPVNRYGKGDNMRITIFESGMYNIDSSLHFLKKGDVVIVDKFIGVVKIALNIEEERKLTKYVNEINGYESK